MAQSKLIKGLNQSIVRDETYEYQMKVFSSFNLRDNPLPKTIFRTTKRITIIK
jgi:hypothetical protein